MNTEPNTNLAFRRKILDPAGDFRKSWVEAGKKQVAPVPLGQEINRILARKMHAGSLAVDSESIIVCSLEEDAANTEPLILQVNEASLYAHFIGTQPPTVTVTENLAAAILFLKPGFGFIAGSTQFMRAAFPEGVDQLRANFSRYARKVEPELPGILDIAHAFPPRKHTWSTPDEVEENSGTGEQLRLLKELADHRVAVPDFARSWMEARRRAMDAGERVRDPLNSILENVFFTLEDYSIDPSFSEPEDLTDEEVISRVCSLVGRLQEM